MARQPPHALHPVHQRGHGGRGAGCGRLRRAHGDHHLVEQALTRASGNIIDLCPVGALNFEALRVPGQDLGAEEDRIVDVLDAVGCNIRVDSRGSEVMRVLPRLNEDVNEEWISDKTRFSYDGLAKRRLDVPMVTGRPAGGADPVEGRLRGHPPAARGRGWPQGRIHRRRSGRRRDHGAGARAGGAARLPERRLPAGRRPARRFQPGRLPVQLDHRRDRTGRCLPRSGRTRAGRPPSSTPVCASAGVGRV